MLIVIGDPDLLRNDDSWASFLNFCARKGACTGYLPEEFENEGGNTKIATIDKSWLQPNSKDKLRVLIRIGLQAFFFFCQNSFEKEYSRTVYFQHHVFYHKP